MTDDVLEAWHQGYIPGELWEALGLTHEQYAAWVEGRITMAELQMVRPS